MIAVSQYLTRGHGQGKINLELLVRLVDRGWPVEAVCTWLEPEAAADPRLRWRRVPVSRSTPTNWLRCELFRRRAELLVRNEAPVAINNGAAAVTPSIVSIAMFVHSAWGRSPHGPSVSLSPRSSLEAAFTAHQSRLEKQAFRQSQRVVALSDRVRDELLEHCGLASESVGVITPGVDATTFRPREADEANRLREACRIGAKDDRPLAVFVGEIQSRRKNLDLVLRALRRRPEWLLAVIGSTRGSLYPAMAEKLSVGDRVFFLDQRSDVPDLMRGADLFAFPTHYEPFGLVVTEAMASGLPVVVTRQAGASCVVEDGQHGWILSDGEDLETIDQALADAMDPALRRSRGASARRAAERMSWDRMTDAYEELLIDEGLTSPTDGTNADTTAVAVTRRADA